MSDNTQQAAAWIQTLDDQQFWPPSDLEVLRKVTSEWPEFGRDSPTQYLFFGYLGAILSNRKFNRNDLHEQPRNGFDERLHGLTHYEIGDYSRAALLAMKVDVPLETT